MADENADVYLSLWAALRGHGCVRRQPPGLGRILETSCFSVLWRQKNIFHSSGNCSTSTCFCGRICAWRNVLPVELYKFGVADKNMKGGYE